MKISSGTIGVCVMKISWWLYIRFHFQLSNDNLSNLELPFFVFVFPLNYLQNHEKAPEITRQRLYLEAMEEILPDITKYIISEETGGNLLEFLPLTPAEIPDTLNP